MNFREICRVLGVYLYFFAGALCLPLLVAVYYQFFALPQDHPQPHSTWAFLLTIVSVLIFASVLRYLGRKGVGELYRREALTLVVLIWFVSAAIGGLPFIFSGTLSSPIDAYFEAMSGLTTTGASVMQAKDFDEESGETIPIYRLVRGPYHTEYMYYGTIDPVLDPVTGEILAVGIEAVSKAVLFWRSFMQWLGGMGIVVLFIAILPALGVGGKVLFQAEVPGPTKEGLTPRIQETAGVLWKLYLGLSLTQVFLLLLTNADMTWFDAICVSLSSISTGGFSVRNASIASYNNANTEFVILIFMLMGSINFSLFFYCLKRQFYRLKDREFLVYISVWLPCCLFISYNLMHSEVVYLTGEVSSCSVWDSFRIGFFHLTSAMTSTGFAFADFDQWIPANQVVLLTIMYVGSMAGSTGGGIKIIRHYMLFKVIRSKVEAIFRPDTVRPLRVGSGQEISTHVSLTVLSYYMIVVGISTIGVLLLVLDGVDPETALSVNACMINNIGLAFRVAGPSESFAFLSDFGKILSSILMVLGRLEFFAVLVLLVPAFWRER